MEKLTYVTARTYLFRFMDHRTPYFWDAIANILSRNELYLNSRNNFNDPFDCRPIIENDLSNRVLSDYIDEAMKEPFNPIRSPLSIAKILDMRADGKARLKKGQLAEIKELLHKNAQTILDGAGLLSFSMTAENSLLWGHYAASFAGLCAVFRRSESTSSGFVMCAEVAYVADRPRLPLSLIQEMSRRRTAGEENGDLTNRILSRSFLNKSIDWSYEQEARIFYPSRAGKHLNFEASELVGFILGPNSPIELQKRMKREISAHRPSASLDQASLSQRDFRIVIPHKYLRYKSGAA